MTDVSCSDAVLFLTPLLDKVLNGTYCNICKLKSCTGGYSCLRSFAVWYPERMSRMLWESFISKWKEYGMQLAFSAQCNTSPDDELKVFIYDKHANPFIDYETEIKKTNGACVFI